MPTSRCFPATFKTVSGVPFGSIFSKKPFWWRCRWRRRKRARRRREGVSCYSVALPLGTSLDVTKVGSTVTCSLPLAWSHSSASTFVSSPLVAVKLSFLFSSSEFFFLICELWLNKKVDNFILCLPTKFKSLSFVASCHCVALDVEGRCYTLGPNILPKFLEINKSESGQNGKWFILGIYSS